MLITFKELYHDTYHFFSKKIRIIFFISIIVTFISLITDMFIQPNMHIKYIIENNQFSNARSLLELLNNMNLEDKHALLKYAILKIIELLMNKTLLLGSIITFVYTVSHFKKQTILSYLYSLFIFLPSLFILNLLTTFITQLGFILFIIPGILLSMMLSLSPIVFSFKRHGLIESIRFSIYISWNHIKIIGPGVLCWIFGKFILTTLLSNIYFINKNIIFLILNISINILYSILIIYLFRFYMILSRS